MGDLSMEEFIRNEVEKAVMQSINDLGIKSIMREKIVEAGITKEDIRNMISEAVDSYVRSVNIEMIVRNEVNKCINKRVGQSIDSSIKSMFECGGYDYRPNSIMRKTMEEEICKAFHDNFKMSFVIEPRNSEAISTVQG